MLMHPAIIALTVISGLVSFILVHASAHGLKILRWWDLSSGSQRQLNLERRTYLISTVLAYAMAAQVVSLFVFVNTADNLAMLFSGAMCAAGTLQVNFLGYPTLLVKMLSCFLCGVWLVLNRVDNQGYDYPLIKLKNRFLLAITTLVLVESVMQLLYFLNLNSEVITSCCGTLFSEDAPNIAADLASLPPGPTMIGLFALGGVTLAAGLYFLASRKADWLFSAASLVFGLLALASMLSFISLYLYESPSHHCPFCLLKREYYYLGFPLYGSLLLGAIGGVGTGVVGCFKKKPSLQSVVPRSQKRLCLMSLWSYGIFLALTTSLISASNLRLMA